MEWKSKEHYVYDVKEAMRMLEIMSAEFYICDIDLTDCVLRYKICRKDLTNY